MRLRTPAPDWGNEDYPEDERARCLEEDPEIFFEDEWLALQICNTGTKDVPGPCPLRQECLTWSLVNNLAYGVYGGLPEYDRRQLRRNNPKKTWRQLAWHEPTPPELREDDNDQLDS